MKFVLGVDPGIYGSFCLFANSGSFVKFWAMPTTGGKVCPVGIINLYREINEEYGPDICCFIEQVITIPSDSLSVSQWNQIKTLREKAALLCTTYERHKDGGSVPRERFEALFCDLKAEVEYTDWLISAQYRPDGRKGVLTMSKAAGYLWAGLVYGWKIEEVHPRTWQAIQHRGCDAKKAKDRSLIAFKRKFPHLINELTPGNKRKPHDGYVDAALIADWGLRHG